MQRINTLRKDVSGMKSRSIKALLLSLVMAATLVPFIGNVPVQADIAAANRGIVFPYMFSGGDWSAGFNQDSMYIDFDVTVAGLHSFEMEWPRSDTTWQSTSTKIHYLAPINNSALNVEIASVTVAGRGVVANRGFGHSGGFWNNISTTLFGNISVKANDTISNIPGYAIRQFDLSNSMGSITKDDKVVVTIRVGPRPVASKYGDVNNDGVIDAADATMLRRYIISSDKTDFMAVNDTFNSANSDIAGKGVGSLEGLKLLRKYIAMKDKDEDILKPPKPRYFIAFTFDDGPNGPRTEALLNEMEKLNNRSEVVCGRNGVDACGVGIGCGTVCGTKSRAQLSFYVMGKDGFEGGSGNPTAPQSSPLLVKRMLAEGHSVENHTYDHNIAPSTGIFRSGPNGMDDHGPNNGTRAFIKSQIDKVNNTNIIPAANGVTDFYGNTYSASNPHKTFSFRPNHFTMNMNAYGLDQELNDGQGMPWIFGVIDPWDWTGHKAEFIEKFILEGALADCGGSPVTQHDCVGGSMSNPTQWCSIRNSSYGGAADGGANGGVVLLHDGGLGWPRQPTIDATINVIPKLQDMGYHIVTIEQLFYYMNAEPEWIPEGMIPMWQGAEYYAQRKAYDSPPGDTRIGRAEGQGSQYGVNGSVKQDQGDRAEWMARTGYTDYRIFRNGGRP